MLQIYSMNIDLEIKKIIKNSIIFVFSVLLCIILYKSISIIMFPNIKFAIIPVLFGYLLFIYTFFRKYDSFYWREGVAAYFYFAFLISISVILRLYKIQTNDTNIIIISTVACLPLVYIFKLKLVPLIYLFIILLSVNPFDLLTSVYLNTGVVKIIALITFVPYYYYIYINKTNGVILNIYNQFIPFYIFLIPFSLIDASCPDILLLIISISIYSLCLYLGDYIYTKKQNLLLNQYSKVGYFGLLLIYFVSTDSSFVDSFYVPRLNLYELIRLPDFYCTIIFSLSFIFIFIKELINKKIQDINLIHFISILYMILMLTNISSYLFSLCVNLMILAFSLIKVINGFIKNKSIEMNFGLILFILLLLQYLLYLDINSYLLILSCIIVFFVFIGLNVLNKHKNNMHE